MTIERFCELLHKGTQGKGDITEQELEEGWHYCYDNFGCLINSKTQDKFPIQERCECGCNITVL